MEKLGSLKPLFLFCDQVVCKNLLFNQRTALKLRSNVDNAQGLTKKSLNTASKYLGGICTVCLGARMKCQGPPGSFT